MEVSTNLGRVSVVPKGTYSPDTKYERLDLIHYQGSGYVVLREVQGVEPAGGEDYMLLIEGSAGPDGRLPEELYAVRVQSGSPELGAVSGGGMVFGGVLTTVNAMPKGENKFIAWLENGEAVSSAPSYTFPANHDRTLLASFEEYVFLRWAESAMPSDNNWYSAAYGNGTFVAIVSNEHAGSSAAAYSSDGGKTWTKSTLPSAALAWLDVAYGNGAFVAISAVTITDGEQEYGSNKAAYSSNGGKSWSSLTMPSKKMWKCIAFGDGVFVATAWEGDCIAYSTDTGKSWTEVSIPFHRVGIVAYGNGSFVVIESDGNRYSNKAVYSTDGGKSWTESALPTASLWNSIAYGGGVFVAVCSVNSDLAAYSADNGKTWALSHLPSVGRWCSIAYGNGAFVAIAQGTTENVAYSIDGGKTWCQSTPLPAAKWNSLAYGDGTFVALSDGSIAAYTA
ncbi:MAG: glycoside hydrolase [Oscillospiraceae bacterium]|nr:glycoside hydrolase [Oscillospiraceae bacterium]